MYVRRIIVHKQFKISYPPLLAICFLLGAGQGKQWVNMMLRQGLEIKIPGHVHHYLYNNNNNNNNNLYTSKGEKVIYIQIQIHRH